MEMLLRLLRKFRKLRLIMLEILSLNFLRLAFIGALLSASSTALLSVFISLKKISYMGEALSHVAFAGIALALLLGKNINSVTILFVVIVALCIGIISKGYHLEEANITTIFLSVSMAIGIILISLKKDYTIDVESYLFGNVLLMTRGDIFCLLGLLLINLFFLLLFFKEIFYITYNQEMAKIYKIPVNLTYFLFIILISINIVISVKIIGIILITAELILPGITALNITKRIKLAIIISVLISQLSSVLGFYMSYIMDIPSGATIVLTLFVMFLVSLLYKSVNMKLEKIK